MNDFLSCPSCGSLDARKVPFTWWGGVLGPALFTHVRCQACGTQYNGKTGLSNDTAIGVIVMTAVILLGVVLYFVIVRM